MSPPNKKDGRSVDRDVRGTLPSVVVRSGSCVVVVAEIILVS